MKKKQKGPMDNYVRKPEVVVQMRKEGKLKQSVVADAFDKERRAKTIKYIAGPFIKLVYLLMQLG